LTPARAAQILNQQSLQPVSARLKARL